MICRDKGYTYTLLHETVPMAKTLRVYDPEGSSEKKVSYEHAIDSVCKEFSFPCIIKMNRGTM
jgi:glutathione synthase/RimK-type ligase-like ATP-grasp enzyme